MQGKTKLETNLQSASLLPHYNTFEARAMRVVISDLPPEFPADEKQGPLATTDELDVFDHEGRGFAISDSVVVDVAAESTDPVDHCERRDDDRPSRQTVQGCKRQRRRHDDARRR